MSHQIDKYPYDKTGESHLNKIVGEYHVLPWGKYRVITPEHSPFYADSLKVFDRLTSKELTKDQYKVLNLHLDLTLKTEKEVVINFAVLDPKVSDNVEVVYQTVGGNVNINKNLIELLEANSNDNRKVNWYTGIENKPDGFPVAPHLHHIADVKGWESVISRMRGIRQALLEKDREVHRHILDVFDEHSQGVDEMVELTRQQLIVRLNDHIGNNNNPHGVTKFHVGLDLVPNYPVTTIEQAIEKDPDKMDDESLMTPFHTRRMIVVNYQEPFEEHVNDSNNPHNTTKEDIGLELVENYAVATPDQAKEGLVNKRYMTPYLTGLAIEARALNPFYAHRDNLDNPHKVTKEQVGLGKVQNYPPSTLEIAREGISSVHYSTPYATQETIKSLLIEPMDEHRDRKDNPHNVTKEQVGLGLLENYPPASQEIAIRGESDEHYVTVKSAFDITQTLLVNPINTHRARRDNPHNVTKDQIGLGLVQNLAIANEQQARDGFSNNHYMTPRTTFSAIDVRAGNMLQNHIQQTNPHNITKATLGLGKVENLSTEDLQNIFAPKDHDHPEFVKKTTLDDYVTKQKYSEALVYVDNYIKYAIDRFGKGDTGLTEPTKPTL